MLLGWLSYISIIETNVSGESSSTRQWSLQSVKFFVVLCLLLLIAEFMCYMWTLVLELSDLMIMFYDCL